MKRILLFAICVLCFSTTQADVVERDNTVVNNIVLQLPDFEVYPNPATGDKIQINLKNIGFKHSDDVTLTVTNVIGQQVYTHIVSQSDIAAGNFKISLAENNIGKGIYFIKLVYGEHTSLKKLVVR
jgi:hypothetical protein